MSRLTSTAKELISTESFRILRTKDDECARPTYFTLQRRRRWIVGRWWHNVASNDMLSPVLRWLIAIKPNDSPGITVRVSYVDSKDEVVTTVLTPQHSLLFLGGSYMLLHLNPFAIDCAPSVVCSSDECKGFEVFVNGFVAFSS